MSFQTIKPASENKFIVQRVFVVLEPIVMDNSMHVPSPDDGPSDDAMYNHSCNRTMNNYLYYCKKIEYVHDNEINKET